MVTITIPGLPEYLATLRAKEQQAKAVLARAAGSLMKPLGMEVAAVVGALGGIQKGYLDRVIEIEGIEKAAQAKKDLLNLAKRASELEAAIDALGQGAVEVMNRRTIRPDLYLAADPAGLPDRDPRFGSRMYQDPDTGEWEEDTGQWAGRLRALAELARVKADRIEKQTGKGGRKSFGSRLHGSPEEWLAQACKEFAEAQGCRSQAVVLRMVRAILEAENGKDAMTRLDGKPALHKGRKAVRKVAQTKPKTGAV